MVKYKIKFILIIKIINRTVSLKKKKKKKKNKKKKKKKKKKRESDNHFLKDY